MEPSSDVITRDELARVLNLQSRAYETLIWLSHIAPARPEMFTERTAEALRDVSRCRAWLARFHAQLPARLRPEGDDAEPFALLFASFFHVSFRIERRLHDGRPYYVIAPNKDAADGRRKFGTRTVPRRLKRKRLAEAENLQNRALLELNGGREDADYWAAYGGVMRDSQLQKDLLVWTYAREIVHRSRGAAHGPAVHLVWRQIGRDTRERLTADLAMRSRDRLIAALAAARTGVSPSEALVVEA